MEERRMIAREWLLVELLRSMGHKSDYVKFYRHKERVYWDGSEWKAMGAHFDVKLRDGRGFYLSPRLKQNHALLFDGRPYCPPRISLFPKE